MTPDLDTHVCPECEQGKHRNCDGSAYCYATDDVVQCECTDPHTDGGE